MVLFIATEILIQFNFLIYLFSVILILIQFNLFEPKFQLNLMF